MAQAWIHLGHYGGSSTAEQAIGSAVPSNHVYQVKVWVANSTGGDLTFTVRHAYADAAASANEQFRAKGATCKANDIVVLPLFDMVATDKLYFTQSANGLACIVDALDIS